MKQGRGIATVRCAIYTRKSTEEGLEQQFNSLDAQREACAAYILSQQHEGWQALEEEYDDGGFSGGSMERPALKRLLEDVKTGGVDVIVVYKVDRLTRSLADFAKIVEILDASEASFVSVTQAFNTTNSMGRLTLNVLLSFAQFEREVTAERIRDKIAASRRKGMWTGGSVPIGYEVEDKHLVINEEEAEIVRLIFKRHLELTTIRALIDDLDRRGLRTKVRHFRNGRVVGGIAFSDGTLRCLLSNPIYKGYVRQGDKLHPGQHKPIIDPQTWRASQRLLALAGPKPSDGYSSPFKGRITDGRGQRLLSVHTFKENRRYRYYVSKTRDAAGAWRLPAGNVEQIVADTLKHYFKDHQGLAASFGSRNVSTDLVTAADRIASDLASFAGLHSLVHETEMQITVEEHQIKVTLDRAKLGNRLGLVVPSEAARQPISIEIPVALRKRGQELRIINHSRLARRSNRDERLIRLIAQGWRAYERLDAEANQLDSATRRHLNRFAKLRFLAPDIITAILDGKQPVELTSRKLMRTGDLPLSWQDQRRVLGFS